jgi:ubiquinone/menaquinone biosynthesis C-methylase UbiE
MTGGYVHGYTRVEQERLLSQADHWRDELILEGTALVPGTRLLEVGCGVGAVLGILGEAFPEITLAGVDLEERQLEAARARLATLGLTADLRRADALELPFEEASFDRVWMMWLLEHVADPLAALREAHRVLAPGGAITAIEVDYNSVWSSPSSHAVQALFAAVAGAMDASGRSDTGAHLGRWLAEAGFRSVDPGERRVAYSGAGLSRQVPYVIGVVESTLVAAPDVPESQREAGVAALQALPAKPDAVLGWTLYKASGVRR